MGRGDSGKKLEAECRKYLEELMKDPGFWYYRFPDARACRGRGVQKAPADYYIKYNGVDALLDPKETKTDRFNFKSRCSQLPIMNRFGMAGSGQGWFLIRQTVSNKYYLLWAGTINKLKAEKKKSILLTDLTAYSSAKETIDHLLRAARGMK